MTVGVLTRACVREGLINNVSIEIHIVFTSELPRESHCDIDVLTFEYNINV